MDIYLHSTNIAPIVEFYQKLRLLLTSPNIWFLFWFQVEKEYTIYKKEQARLIKIFLVSLILAIFIGYFYAISRESSYITGPKMPEIISASNATMFGKLFFTQQPIIVLKYLEKKWAPSLYLDYLTLCHFDFRGWVLQHYSAEIIFKKDNATSEVQTTYSPLPF